MKNEKTIENKLRRRLLKMGYLLRKSRRGFNRCNLGGYMIIDADCNAVIAGRDFALDIDDVEQFINE